VAALIRRDGRLLICQRRADDHLALQWEFPGGKVQPGESLEHALRRELQEELAVEAAIGREIFVTRFTYEGLRRTVELHFFAAHLPPHAALHNRAFEQIQWVEPQALLQYDFLPADRALVEKLAAGDLARWTGLG
jgi:8-oxo-dGTP diphosphatase